MAKPFESRLNVFYIREKYIAPYKKCKFISITKASLKTAKTFEKLINERAKEWPNGGYLLKMSTGELFVRLDVFNKKVKKLYKTSPITGKKYPISEWV